MNVTGNEISFFSHEDFLSFLERFGKGRKEFASDWFGLDADLTCGNFYNESDKSHSSIDEEKNVISFYTRWPDDIFELIDKMAQNGVDFKYKFSAENGLCSEGFCKGKKRFVTRVMDGYGELDDVAEEGDIPLFERLPELTKKHAKLHSLVKKIFSEMRDGEKILDYDKSGEFGIISEFTESCIKVSLAQIDENGDYIPSDKLLAEYRNIEDFIAAGWTIDVSFSGLDEAELWPKGDNEPPEPADLTPPAAFGGIPF